MVTEFTRELGDAVGRLNRVIEHAVEYLRLQAQVLGPEELAAIYLPVTTNLERLNETIKQLRLLHRAVSDTLGRKLIADDTSRLVYNGYELIPSARVHVRVKDPTLFRGWCKTMSDEVFIQTCLSKAALKRLVEEELAAGRQVPPGLEAYIESYIRTRTARG